MENWPLGNFWWKKRWKKSGKLLEQGTQNGQKCWKRQGKGDGKVDHSREKWKRLGKKRKSWVCRCKNWHLTTDNWKINQPTWLSPTRNLNLVIQPPNVQVSLNWCTEIACLKSPYLGYQKSSKIGATISPRWKYSFQRLQGCLSEWMYT